MKKDLRIIYMGTPDFAVAGLKILLENKVNVVAVITVPDKPAGRGLKVQMSPVKELALQYNIPVLQPEKLKAPEFLEELRSYQANLQIVVAFRMLPEVVWNMPELGTFNLHASLLPQYRGAAPINWALINGEKETGVTTFFLKHEIDTGDIIFQEKVTIGQNENVGELYERLMHLGAEVILKTVRAIEEDTCPAVPQAVFDNLKSAPKIFKETCKIDWTLTAEQVSNFIRGLSPYPSAWTSLNGVNYKIYAAELSDAFDAEVGSVISDGKTFLKVRTSDAALSITELQMEGKRKMQIGEFLRGNKI